jgi:large subunit ribosomal protein L24
VTVEGTGSFDRVNTSGRLALNSSAASLGQITALIAPLAPALAARLNAMEPSPGPARLKLTLDVDKKRGSGPIAPTRASRSSFDAPQLKAYCHDHREAGSRGDACDRSRCAATQANSASSRNCPRSAAVHCLPCLGLDRAIAGGEGAAQFEGSVAGVWRAPLRLKAKMSGAGFDADAQGTAEPWAAEPKANVNLAVRGVNLAPLFNLKPSDSLAQNISLSSRASLTANKLTFDDLGGTISGSQLRGRIALALG